MSEPRRWNLVAEGLILAVSGGPSVSLQEAEKGIPVIEAEPVLARIKEAEELLKFYARMHDRNKDSFFERNRAREYLKKWEGEK